MASFRRMPVDQVARASRRRSHRSKERRNSAIRARRRAGRQARAPNETPGFRTGSGRSTGRRLGSRTPTCSRTAWPLATGSRPARRCARSRASAGPGGDGGSSSRPRRCCLMKPKTRPHSTREVRAIRPRPERKSLDRPCAWTASSVTGRPVRVAPPAPESCVRKEARGRFLGRGRGDAPRSTSGDQGQERGRVEHCGDDHERVHAQGHRAVLHPPSEHRAEDVRSQGWPGERCGAKRTREDEPRENRRATTAAARRGRRAGPWPTSRSGSSP